MSLSYEVTADFLVSSQDLSRKYMRCSSRVTVYHLKRFLLQKLCIPALYDVSPNKLDESHSLNLHIYTWSGSVLVPRLSLLSMDSLGMRLVRE